MITFRALRHTRIALIVFSLASLASPAYGEYQPNIDNGQMVAARVCAGCHGMNGRQGSVIQGVVVPTFESIALRPDRTQEMLEAFVLVPHWPMPAIPLQSSEIRDVVGYLLSRR